MSHYVQQQRFQRDGMQFQNQNHLMIHQVQQHLNQQIAGTSLSILRCCPSRPPTSCSRFADPLLHPAPEVRSPQPTPSLRQQLNPSPRQPQMSPHHIPPNQSPDPGMHGQDYNQMTSDSVVLSQLQSHNSVPQDQNPGLDMVHSLSPDNEVSQL
ncbi:histone acetyltransferase p300-like [Dreissena polymorpha]|uniref:histone acetyltransferase p300-like n=1 Tax=Dreissena polymorpha TaxID=45954 RepID=UPI002263ADF7|nr:histone acetyltransferase p300-like [Dreissena polymorpha]